jgi:hypothetical protein
MSSNNQVIKKGLVPSILEAQFVRAEAPSSQARGNISTLTNSSQVGGNISTTRSMTDYNKVFKRASPTTVKPSLDRTVVSTSDGGLNSKDEWTTVHKKGAFKQKRVVQAPTQPLERTPKRSTRPRNLARREFDPMVPIEQQLDEVRVKKTYASRQQQFEDLEFERFLNKPSAKVQAERKAERLLSRFENLKGRRTTWVNVPMGRPDTHGMKPTAAKWERAQYLRPQTRHTYHNFLSTYPSNTPHVFPIPKLTDVSLSREHVVLSSDPAFLASLNLDSISAPPKGFLIPKEEQVYIDIKDKDEKDFSHEYFLVEHKRIPPFLRNKFNSAKVFLNPLNKKQRLMGNAAARLLMSKGDYSRKVRDRLVSLADIFVAVVDYETPLPPSPTITDYIFEYVYPGYVSALGEFDNFRTGLEEALSKEPVPYHRACLTAYFTLGLTDPNSALKLIRLFCMRRQPKYRLIGNKAKQFEEIAKRSLPGTVTYQGLMDASCTVFNTVPTILFDVASVASFFSIVREVTSWKAFIAACYQFLRSIPGLVVHAISFFDNVVEGITNVYWEGEGKGLLHDMFEIPLNFIKRTEMGANIMAVLSSFSIIGVLSTFSLLGDANDWKRRAHTLQQVLSSEKTSGLDTFIQKILGFIANSIKRISTCVMKRDLSFLFGAVLPAREWIEWTQHLLYSQELIEDLARPEALKTFNHKMKTSGYGYQISKQLSHKEFLEHLKRSIEMSNPILDAYGGSSVQQNIKNTVKLLEEKKRTIESFMLNGSFRIQPYGIFMPGRPGLGKTGLMKIIHKALGVKLNRDFGSSTIHTVDPGQNFPVFNPCQWFALADDLDKNPNLPAAGAALNHAEIIMKYINNSPLNMEGAAISDKGVNWANFLALVYGTNNPNGRLKHAITTPLAFWRRFKIRVEVELKDEYSKEGIIDEEKIPAGVKNIWKTITVSFIKPKLYVNKDSPAPFGDSIVFRELSEFLKWLGDQVKCYVDRATARQCSDEDTCPICSLNEESHADGSYCTEALTPEQQEARESVNDVFTPAIVEEEFTPLLSQGVVTHQGAGEQTGYFLMCAFALAQLAFFVGMTSSASWMKERFLLYVDWVKIRIIDGAIVAKLHSVYQKWESNLKKSAVFALGLAAGYTSFMMLKKLLGPKVTYQSTESTETPVPNLQKTNSSWTRVPVELSRPYLKLGPKTFTKDDLERFIRDSEVSFKYNGTTVKAHHMSKNFYLTVWHVFGASKNGSKTTPVWDGTAEVVHKNMTKLIVVHSNIVVQVPGKDMCVIYLPEMGAVPPLKERLSPTSLCAGQLMADKGLFVGKDGVSDLASLRTTNNFNGARLNTYLWEYSGTTVNGDCGCFVIGTFANNFSIVAMHFAKMDFATGGSASYGEDISQNDLQVAYGVLEQRWPTATVRYECSSLSTSEFEFKELPLKSNLGVNLSTPKAMSVLVAGTIPDFRANTFKSKVVPMPHREMWEEIELRECGSIQYYHTPSAKGKMVDDTWVSPFTLNMSSSSDKGGDLNTWWLAIDDYLNGAELLPGRDRVRPLTEFEAIMGVSGTDIGGIDLNTSVGPPFNRPKKNFIKLDHDTKVCEYAPCIADTFRVIDEHLDRNEAVSQVCNYVLKDEPISAAKVESCKVRVFNVLSFAINIRLKQMLGPILIFMRTHPMFFETAIGMNVTCHHWAMLHEWLDVYPNWMAADNENFDVKMSTREGLATTEFLLRLASICNYTPREIQDLRNLLFSCQYTTRICNGDVFYANYMMCTGFWATILFNTIRNCLQRRYCYLLLKPKGHVDLFRDGVRQFTLGDDNVATTRWEWYNQQTIQVAAREFGAVITDSHKNSVVPKFDRKCDVTFLKRSFRLLDGVMVAPIELKTLVKMVTVRTRSSLSDIDHFCQLYSNVLAEAWMHGPEVFSYFSEKIATIVKSEGWISIYYKHLTYDAYLKMYRDGVLSVWDPLQNKQNGE